MTRPRLQPLVRARVASLGSAGEAWHAGLAGVLSDLAERWDLTLGRGLPGGSASYVVEARRADGEERVLKVPLPDADLADEARVLRAADGRGYVRLLDQDPVHQAVLLERLGGQLEQRQATPEEKLGVLADTLVEAWAVDLPALPGQEDKAVGLHRMVTDLDARLGSPTDPGMLRTALAYAESLAGWTGPTVTVPGDPHPANLLRAPDGRGTGWVLVDPDGFRADAAYDAGAALRDWCSRLRGPDARERLHGWCRLVAERTGLDAERVWAWAFVERVSTGLYVTSFGAPRVGAPFLESARALV